MGLATISVERIKSFNAWKVEFLKLNLRLREYNCRLKSPGYSLIDSGAFLPALSGPAFLSKAPTQSANTKRQHKAPTQSANTKRQHKAPTQSANTKRQHKAHLSHCPFPAFPNPFPPDIQTIAHL
ncbi:hypothetical protein GCT13_27450 [Paraburkholderia sp. CNPSo 3157]|uniref:Uncharacterized protein n=1 Tax=Paraburkholderia franconis TaxID=2654983 RepID=A0A7X1NEL7_9BURK|nr:hypothetical protein [Paraburkholderia franconis]MPW20515.1 hypothetical protein [Paraburkholderia franconis]